MGDAKVDERERAAPARAREGAASTREDGLVDLWSPEGILDLQQRIGNQRVTELIQAQRVQRDGEDNPPAPPGGGSSPDGGGSPSGGSPSGGTGDGTPPRPDDAMGVKGDKGDDVGVLQQRLNAVRAADPPLPITAVYDDATQAAVDKYQTETLKLPAKGYCDNDTWAALKRQAPTEGKPAFGSVNKDTTGELDIGAANPATADANPTAGSGSLHPVVGKDALSSGAAVKEFQQKLNNVRRTLPDAKAVSESGNWDDDTTSATQEYQRSKSLTVNSTGDAPTWTALDADAGTTQTGFRERSGNEDVGGHTYVVHGKYAYEFQQGKLVVTVKVNFTGAKPPAAWFGYVTSTWNKFKAQMLGSPDRTMDIEFQMVEGSGGEACSVKVVPAPETGRANAGTWYAADADAANTIPHEFGHLIGLRDEYQLHAGDYREITGHEPPVGDADGPAGVTPEQMAQDLQDKIVARDATGANAATVAKGLKMGAYAQRVVQAYAKLAVKPVPAAPAPVNLPAGSTTADPVKDLDVLVPEDTASLRYNTIQALTYSSGSTMGDPSRVKSSHDHGVQARHVQEFVDIIASREGGTWGAVPK